MYQDSNLGSQLSCREIAEIQKSLIMSNDNQWYAKKYYIRHHGYDPNRGLTNNELVQYWILCGAAKWFRDICIKELQNSS